MAEEEKSAGSGFGKLVYGTLKGNGINTDDLSFDEAVKKFNELGGTDNWHAKIMRKEAEENKEKQERSKAEKNDASKNETLKKIEKFGWGYDSVNSPEGKILLTNGANGEAALLFNSWEDAKKWSENPTYKGMSLQPGEDQKEGASIKPEIKDKVSGWSDDMKYAMLERMQSDAKYYLGFGGRDNKTLWAGNPEDHIQYMQEIYSQLKNKPDWISDKDINSYKSQMLTNGKPEKESKEPKVEDYTEQLQKLSKEQNVDMKYIQEDLQTRLEEGQKPEDALKEIESNLKNAKPESLKEKVDRRIKSFMDKAKKGKIKAEGNAPKEFKWNGKTNSYEYGGANVMKSFVGKDLYEVDVQGEELIVSSLDEAKKKIDQMNAYAKKHNGYMYGQDKYI